MKSNNITFHPKNMDDCLFCKISKKEVPAEIVFENDDLVIFPDINPKSPWHYLVVSKKHISSVKEMAQEDEELLGKMIWAAKEEAQKRKISGYKLVFNVGRGGGQIIDHIHLHLLGFSQ